VLGNNMGRILYYHLVDPAIKKLVEKVDNVRVIVGEVESE